MCTFTNQTDLTVFEFITWVCLPKWSCGDASCRSSSPPRCHARSPVRVHSGSAPSSGAIWSPCRSSVRRWQTGTRNAACTHHWAAPCGTLPRTRARPARPLPARRGTPASRCLSGGPCPPGPGDTWGSPLYLCTNTHKNGFCGIKCIGV